MKLICSQCAQESQAPNGYTPDALYSVYCPECRVELKPVQPQSQDAPTLVNKKDKTIHNPATAACQQRTEKGAVMSQIECPKCKTQVTPNEKVECPTCNTQLQPDRFTASCANFASILKTQMIFCIAPTVQSVMTRNSWGQVDFEFTPMTGVMLGLLAVIALAWFMVRQKIAISVWAPIMVGVAGLALIGRLRLIFGDHTGVPGFALVFIFLGGFLDVGTGWLAIDALKAWRQKQNAMK